MRSFINYFIKYPIAANLIMFGILIMGLVGLSGMKSTFFPEIEVRLVNIQVIYPGASPEEIEEGIINKIEENLKGVSGVERTTSSSRENSGNIAVEVLQGYKTDLVLQDVKNAVDQINSFPVGMEPPVIFKLETLGEAIRFALSGDVDLSTLKRYGRQVEEDLLAIEGISKVTLTGFPEEEIEIALREKDLRAYNLTFTQVAQAVQGANLELTGGTLKGEKEEFLLRARNKSYYAEGLRDIVVKRGANGSTVTLAQVADIRDQWVDNPERNYINGKPSVVVNVQNTLDEDMLTIVESVKAYMDRFNQSNKEVQAILVNDQSEVLRDRISLLTENGILGFFIVILLLSIFLNYRVAFWVAISIPISFAGMFVIANALGVSINVLSLFGMILVIGILVDDGIVIAENIYQKYEEGMPRLQAAIEGTMEVLPAVFSSILTTVVAFAAFFFIDGRLGDFFTEMSVVVIFSLVFSLVEGMVILPTHIAHSKALNPEHRKYAIQEWFERMLAFLRDRLYGPSLRFAMHNKLLAISFMVALLMITFGAISGGVIKTTFFPIIERDDLNIVLKMPAGTREEVTEQWLDHIESAAWRANEKLSQQYFNGEKEAVLYVQKAVGPSTYEGKVDIKLLTGELRDSLRVREVINTIREEAGPIYEAEVVSFGSESAFGKPFDINVIGDDKEVVSAASAELKAAMQRLEELSDVVDDNQEGLREFEIRLKDKAAFLGLDVQDVLNQVRQGFFGTEVQRLQRGRDEVRVWVRYDEEDRSDVTQLSAMRIRFPDGRSFPLSEIADVEMKRGVISINHVDGKRRIKVEGDVANDQVSVSDVTAALQTTVVPEILNKYAGVRIEFDGQFREQQKSSGSIGTVGIVLLSVMFLIIALTFRSVSQTLVVFSLIPFALIGVGWGHYLLGLPISLFSNLGIIALVGVLVNDTLVLISNYNQRLEAGMPQMEALYEAGVSRFRPILLTSLTTFAGLAPLLLEKSLQAQFLIPMAASVSFGLLVITVVILVLLPVLLIIVNRFKVYASWAWNGVKPSYESVEPATGSEGGYQYIWLLLFAVVALVLVLNILI